MLHSHLTEKNRRESATSTHKPEVD